MKYEPIDDEVAPDDIDYLPEPEEPISPQPPIIKSALKPEVPAGGEFSRNFAGHTVWFRAPKPFQTNAINRMRAAFINRMKVIKDSGAPEIEQLGQLRDLSYKFDEMCLELVESLIVVEADVDHLLRAQLRGDVSPQQIIGVLYDGTDEPDDDEDAKPVAKKAVKAARPNPVKKKTANVGRTRR